MTRRPDKTDTGFKLLKAEAAKGKYTMIDPMDYMIVGHLNDEGTTFANIYPLGHTVKQLVSEVFEKKIPTSMVAPRMGSLKAQGIVIDVASLGAGGATAYQRTPLGKKLFEKWSENHGHES